MADKVGYLGTDTPRGPDTTTFGYMAATQYFSQRGGVEFTNFRSHAEICEAAAQRKIKYGVVAIENVIAGIITETIYAIRDAEIHGGVRVCGEVALPIELFYLKKGSSKKKPDKVISHPVALAQCDAFVRQLKDKGMEVEIRQSTGEAAQEASRNRALAVIASKRAEEMYGLTRIVPTSVVDHQKSATRFWILGKEHADRTGKDRTALQAILRQDEAGALWKTLGCFVAELDENGAYRIKPSERRPNLLIAYPIPILGKQWEYTFLLEFSGHIDDPSIAEAMRTFAQSGISYGPAHFLGSYPEASSAIETR